MHLFAKISLFSLLFLSSLPLTVFSSSLRSDVASSLNGEGIARQHDMLQKVLQFEGTMNCLGGKWRTDKDVKYIRRWCEGTGARSFEGKRSEERENRKGAEEGIGISGETSKGDERMRAGAVCFSSFYWIAVDEKWWNEEAKKGMWGDSREIE